MNAAPYSRRKLKSYFIALVAGFLGLALAGAVLLFAFWPFRYREVHPLLQQTFRSRVEMKSYHRTYFPHPGYVAEGVVIYRHGDTQIPALATIERMVVEGSWINLVVHPHMLYQIRLSGLHVQIPPPGTAARRIDFDQGVVSSSRQKIEIKAIIADGTTLDVLREHGAPPLRFYFSTLEVYNVQPDQPLTFSAKVVIPRPQGTVLANGSIGPASTSNYAQTPLSGAFSLSAADLSKLHGISGTAAATGHYSGTFSKIDVLGKAAIPDFHAGSAQPVPLNAEYHLTVNATNGDVEIQNAQVQSRASVISARGLIAGSPKKLSITLATKNSPVGDLLKMIQRGTPSVTGTVSFKAAVNMDGGPGDFLQRMHLKGNISLAHMGFIKADTQHEMDAFSSRVRKGPSGDTKNHPTRVTADARSQTRFLNGIAYFPDLHVALPGARARVHGDLNLIDGNMRMTGKVMLERDISRAATGWKSLLLKPLIPFFRHQSAGAIVSIAVTGTPQHPSISQILLPGNAGPPPP